MSGKATLQSLDEVRAALPVERLKAAFDTLATIHREYYEYGEDWNAVVEAKRQILITARELHGPAAIDLIESP